MAGEEIVAGVDYNDERHVAATGISATGKRGIHGSGVEDVTLTREARAVRREKPRQTKIGRIRHDRCPPLAEYVAGIRFAMIEQLTHPMAIRADLRAYTQKLACEPD